MKLWVGTSGYSYKEWKGSFYPQDLAAKEMLRYYATQLPSVEINNTFYRLPKAEVLRSWAEQVPDDFRFAIKASRRITHLKRLKDTDSETTYLLDTVETLGERLGVVLYQCPPNLKKDLPRLQGFLQLLTNGTRAVFEFRHPSWLEDDVLDCLRDQRCAICVSDVDDEQDARLIPTTRWGYVRLRRASYAEADLARWAERLHEQGWDEAFVFFKHEDEGSGPKLATQFLEVAEKRS